MGRAQQKASREPGREDGHPPSKVHEEAQDQDESRLLGSRTQQRKGRRRPTQGPGPRELRPEKQPREVAQGLLE